MRAQLKEAGSRVFFPNLDGLRFIAFLFVFLSHTLLRMVATLDLQESFLKRFLVTIASGETGVSIFFVLSGYLITYLILNEISLKGKLNVLFFYMRRILQIWPLYYLVILFSVVLFPVIRSYFPHTDIANTYHVYFYFLFLSNFETLNVIRHLNTVPDLMAGITWSVAIEEQFYVVWPLLFYFSPARFYKYIFVAVILLSIGYRATHLDYSLQYYHSLSVCADFAVGGLCGYLSLFDRRFRLFFYSLPTRIIAIAYLAGFAWLMFGAQVFSPVFSSLFTRLLSTTFFAFVIVEQNFSRRSFYKFSASRFITFWGKYTYGLYLLHPIAAYLVQIIIWKVIKAANPESLSWLLAEAGGGLLVSLALSYLSYEYYEKRFLIIKEKFGFIHKTKLATAA